jgi:hypothetical protein
LLQHDIEHLLRFDVPLNFISHYTDIPAPFIRPHVTLTFVLFPDATIAVPEADTSSLAHPQRMEHGALVCSDLDDAIE